MKQRHSPRAVPGDRPARRLSPRLAWALAVALVPLTLAVFHPLRGFQFVSWDDPFYVTENPHVLAGLTGDGVRWALTAGAEFYWHPLTWLSHMLDVQVFGLWAGGHHLVNLGLHLATSLLLLAALYRMTGALGRSAFVAAVFAVHPLHVESVAWVAERKDVLSGLGWALTLCAYTLYMRRPGGWRWGLVVAGFAVGLMAKPMIVTLPVALLLLDVWPLRRLETAAGGDRPAGLARGVRALLPLVREKTLLFALALLAGGATFLYQYHAAAVRSLDTFPLSARLGNALVSYATYLRSTVWPSGLAGFYPYPRTLPWATVAGAAVLLLGVSALVWRVRRHRYMVVGWLWFLVTLLPVIGVIQVGDQAMADRFMYVPIVGLLLMAAWGLPDLGRALGVERWAGRTGAAAGGAALASLAVLALAWVASGQVSHWRDSEALWRRAAAVTRDNQRAHANLGILYANQGRVDEAVAELSEAVRIVPGAADLHNRLGALRLQQGRVQEAREAFARAVGLWPHYADAHNNLGSALEREGRLADAVAQYREAVRLRPDYAVARDNLATALAGQGLLDEAVREGQEAVRVAPGFVQARNNLGLILVGAGRPREAIEQYEAALRIAPDYAVARANLAGAYGLVGRFEEASQAYRDALRQDPRRPDWHFQLALTLHRLGDTATAVEHLGAALAIDPAFLPARRALEALDAGSPSASRR